MPLYVRLVARSEAPEKMTSPWPLPERSRAKMPGVGGCITVCMAAALPASFSTETLSRVPGSFKGQRKSIRSGETASTGAVISLRSRGRRPVPWKGLGIAGGLLARRKSGSGQCCHPAGAAARQVLAGPVPDGADQ
jgi:hypothetical protein